MLLFELLDPFRALVSCLHPVACLRSYFYCGAYEGGLFRLFVLVLNVFFVPCIFVVGLSDQANMLEPCDISFTGC